MINFIRKQIRILMKLLLNFNFVKYANVLQYLLVKKKQRYY